MLYADCSHGTSRLNESIPPLRKMQTRALLSSGPPWAAMLLASLRLSSVLRIADVPTAAQFSCFRKPRRETGLLMIFIFAPLLPGTPRQDTPPAGYARADHKTALIA